MEFLNLFESFLLTENQKRIDFLKGHFAQGFDTSHDTLAKHQNTTKETLRKMQQDSDPEIQEIANKRGK
jgi:hypothetical protein